MNGVTSLPVIPSALSKSEDRTGSADVSQQRSTVHSIYKRLQVIVYLASVTAAWIASSICWPAVACSSGMGTANSTPLWRPSDRVLAE